MRWTTASFAFVHFCLAAPPAPPFPISRARRRRPPTPGEATAVFAGGCFWGVDAVFKHVKGVKNVVSGYSGGTPRPRSTMLVGTGTTGHAESVQGHVRPVAGHVRRPAEGVLLRRARPDGAQSPGPRRRHAIPLGDLLRRTRSRRSSRSATSRSSNAAKAFGKPIVTEVAALDKFYPAEDYHQNYLALHPNQPYIVYNDLPKLEALKKQFPAWYRP